MLASVADQANLSLTWSETPEDTFSHNEAHTYSGVRLTEKRTMTTIINHNRST